MNYQMCSNCIMDTTAEEITFDENGVCNFCTDARRALMQTQRDRLNHKALFASTGKDYDVLIGLSGGVDSSYALHLAVSFGLKPLCFTIDNGWNDRVADENILKLVEGMKVPLIRYTIDLNKFARLQGAFLSAGVKNVEIPTDHILMAASLELAAKYGIKTILSGGNVATESIMPASWGHNARDLTHIKAIYRKFTSKSLKGLPLCSVWKWNYYKWIKGIRTIYLLDYVTYNREGAIEVLKQKYGYEYPGEKHEESVWTKWFQNFYLFEKWGIDKRKAHFSSLIASGQLTRKEALERLEANPIYPELGLEKRVMGYEKHEHADYPMDKWYDRIAWLVKTLKHATA